MRKDVLRYMGFRNSEPTDAQKAQIEQICAALEREVTPKSVYACYPVEKRTDKEVVIAGIQMESQKLATHLLGCDRAVLLAATLGTAADQFLRRSMVESMLAAQSAQAAAAAYLEDYLDDLCDSIAGAHGCYLTPRFSPGYGDLPLTLQGALLSVLDAPKRIGLSLTDGYMMVPAKSVTAICGMTDEPTCHTGGCAACDRKTCAFRRT